MTEKIFPLAAMSRDIRFLTMALLVLPPAMVTGALLHQLSMLFTLPLIAAAYAAVWLWYRPGHFVVTAQHVELVFPLRRLTLERRHVTSARILGGQELRQELGWSLRIGAGGLWGAFGWLWTHRHGLVHLYTSRTSDLVLLECGRDKPWLLSPERPEEFIREVLR